VIAEKVASRGRRAAEMLRAQDGEAAFVHTDVAGPGAVERAVSAALRRFGSLDVVVNNAGIIDVGRLEQLSRRSIVIVHAIPEHG
jgi:NAD(P)-dependent dehydrogenase (short-subunit alcohol dehydrogenase family)